MKIAGIVIQNKRIRLNDSRNFSAHYKNHLIDVMYYNSRGKDVNPEWLVMVLAPSGSYACNTTIQRCTIRDAVIYALEQSNLVNPHKLS